MTEDEAKKKWCPFVRVTIDVDRAMHAENRYHTGSLPLSAACVGSHCMAWRGSLRGATRHRETGAIRLLSPGDTYDPRNEIHYETDDPSSGYCGLAGEP